MKITINILFCLLLITTSCKKEEVIMGCTNPAMFNYNVNATNDDGSCVPFIYGCMDPTMFNFDPNANSPTNDCMSAYNIAQGTWNINPDCDEYTIPVINQTISLNDQLPESIDVEGSGDNSTIYIDIDGTQVNGEIDIQGNITVPEQTIEIDMGFGPMDIDVEGSGVIISENSGDMDLTYSFEVETIPGFPISESLDCSIELSK
tara:strand:- start:406 stop:1017 length:612 start_codon:yes stop_codon:yes gene_type:complete